MSITKPLVSILICNIPTVGGARTAWSIRTSSATGERGPVGPPGDKGDTGKSKDLSISTVEGNIARDGFCVDGCSDTEKSVASCNSDEGITGGGVQDSAGHVLYSKPIGNSWEAKGVSQGGQNPSTTQAYAHCHKLAPQ